MSLPKFPRSALQVLRIIRAEVPRPEELPARYRYVALRWFIPDNATGHWNCCPMGRHHKSTVPGPCASIHFADGRCAESSVLSFGHWWDEIGQSSAQEARDFVWPEVAS